MLSRFALCLLVVGWARFVTSRQPPLPDPGEQDLLTLIARSTAQPGGRSNLDAWTKGDMEVVAMHNTLDHFHDAAAKADFDAYFSAWTHGSVFLGTDASERWVGDQFKDFAKPIFETGKGWAYRPHDRHITVLDGGRAAFFDELLDNDKLGLCRGSGVLAKRGDEWKILQYNLSIPVPNDLAAGIVETIRKAPPAGPQPGAPKAPANPKE